MNRRDFLQATSGAALVAMASSAVAAIQQDEKPAAPPIRLGIDCYSLHGYGWKAIQLLDYAASLQVDAIQVNIPDFESLDDEYLRTVKEHADRLGVTIEPGINSICPLSKTWNARRQGTPTEHLRLGLRLAKALGASAVKCYLGNAADRRGPTPIPALIDASIKSLRSVRSEALDAGVKFAVENHGDLLAREVKTIIEEAGSDFVGCCLDSGNPVTLAEDPLLALEILGPYTVTTHIRDSVVYEDPNGAAYQWVALGDGCIDFHTFVARFRELCPQAPFLLEILTGSPPRVLAYLEPEYWKAFPSMPAADFARFLALTKKGHPFTGSMMIASGENQPPEYQAALKHQQRMDLERSLEYAKKTLNLGVKWRESKTES
jgi:sugar phosphate isomerase/epimerase